MQTFLPYADFEKTAKCLDMRRLGKQRVECLQILQVLSGEKPDSHWKNHPAVKMWEGSFLILCKYGFAICQEWINRGYKDTCFKKINYLFAINQHLNIKSPKWLGDESFHAAHRSNLLRKSPEWYGQFSWIEPDNLPYIWPEN
jgi:hypothetical protein